MNEPEDTSMDELAASLGVRYPSPARTRTASKIFTPIAARSPIVRRKQFNFDVTPSLLQGASPSKSMLLSPGLDSDTNPWQIKVTVQAQPRDGHGIKSPSPRTKTLRVPLNDGTTPPRVKKNTKRRSDTESAIKNRKGTPMRRRSDAATMDESSMADTWQADIPPPESQPNKRVRDRPEKSTVVYELDSILGGEAESLPSENQSMNDDQEDKYLLEASHYNLSTRSSELGSTTHLSENFDVEHAEDEHQEQEVDEQADAEIEEVEDEDEDEVPNTMSEQKTGHHSALKYFDSTKLTPLHVRHPHLKRVAQNASTTRNMTTQSIDGNHAPRAIANRITFSPLPQRRPLKGRSPSPFRNRVSSPTSLAEADMWRGMIPKPPTAAAVRNETVTDSESNADLDELGDYSDADIPELTTRTAGDATMIQGEDFSIVSLSSLPSRKDIHSSLLEQSGFEQSARSMRRTSRLNNTIGFSPQSSPRRSNQAKNLPSDSVEDEEVPDVEILHSAHRIPQATSRPAEVSRLSGSSVSANGSIPSPAQDVERTHGTSNSAASVESSKLSGLPAPGMRRPPFLQQSKSSPQHRTPQSGPGRLPTPNSSEILNSTAQYEVGSPPRSESGNDLTTNKDSAEHGIDVDSLPLQLQSSPRTPKHKRSSTAEVRASPTVSSSLSKRSWIDEPAPPHIKALERNLQRKRDDLDRTLAMAREGAIEIPSDHSSEEDSDDKSDQPVEPTTADIWQDISVEEDRSALRRQVAVKPRSHTTSKHGRSGPSDYERPAKLPRMDKTYQSTQGDQSVDLTQSTSRPKSQNKNRMTNTQRKNRNESDISAIFRRLNKGNQRDEQRNDLTEIEITDVELDPGQSDSEEKYPYISQHRIHQDYNVNETDLSDVRQLRVEVQQAQRRPPFPVTERMSATQVPTNLKSIDDTPTDLEDDSVLERSSFLSINGSHNSGGTSLFSAPQLTAPKRASQSQTSQVPSQRLIPIKPAARVPVMSDPNTSLFSYLFTAIAYPFKNGASHQPMTAKSTPSQTPTRPTHMLLADEARYPLLPGTWPWSVMHYQVLDNLYQVYKRKPSRFSPHRASSPNNTGLVTPSWSRFIDIELDHWGYRIRLEETHVLLAILFSQLLLLPSEKEWRALHHGEGLEWGEDWSPRCRTFRRGEQISPIDILKKLFGIIAGEFIREDEEAGRKVQRDLVEFRYKLRGDAEWSVFWD